MLSEALNIHSKENYDQNKENKSLFITEKLSQIINEESSYDDEVSLLGDSNYLSTPMFSPNKSPSPFITPKYLKERKEFTTQITWPYLQLSKTPPKANSTAEFTFESPSLMLNLESPKPFIIT